MSHSMRAMLHRVNEVFADRLLQCLLLGVIGAAFLFAFVLRAEPYVVFGVIVVGFATAFLEASHHRRKK